MSEYITPTPEGRFHKMLVEELVGNEFEGASIAVLGIGGLPGTGVSSTCHALADRITAERGIPVHIMEFEKIRNDIYHQKTGIHRVEVNSDAELEASVETDFAMVRQMINPDNRGKLIIFDGRLGPFIAREMQVAFDDLHQQGLLQKPAPFRVLTAYFSADEGLRHLRKYTALRNPAIDPEHFKDSLRKQAVDELAAFKKTWPDLLGANPNSMIFKIRGRDVYDMRYDTTYYTADEMADKMLANPKLQEFLPRPVAA